LLGRIGKSPRRTGTCLLCGRRDLGG
jgi:hypothetical protein